MFKKAVEAKSLQRLSGADKKKLKRNVKDKFPFASDAILDVLLPPKVFISFLLLLNPNFWVIYCLCGLIGDFHSFTVNWMIDWLFIEIRKCSWVLFLCAVCSAIIVLLEIIELVIDDYWSKFGNAAVCDFLMCCLIGDYRIFKDNWMIDWNLVMLVWRSVNWVCMIFWMLVLIGDCFSFTVILIETRLYFEMYCLFEAVRNELRVMFNRWVSWFYC